MIGQKLFYFLPLTQLFFAISIANDSDHFSIETEKIKLIKTLNEVDYKQGITHFDQKNWTAANFFFDNHLQTSTNTKLKSLSQLFLARIAIEQSDFETAKQILDTLKSENELDSTPDAFLMFAISFLQGEMAEKNEEWEIAASFYHKANIWGRENWADNPLFNMNGSLLNTNRSLFNEALCYLKLAEIENSLKSDSLSENLIKTPSPKSSAFFKKADEILDLLLKTEPSDKIYLALAQSHLLKIQALKINESKDSSAKLKELFNNHPKFNDPETMNEALILKAESSDSYLERKKIYQQLIQNENNESPTYGKALYLQGINDFEEAKQSPDHKKTHLNSALLLMEKAFDHAYPNDLFLATAALVGKIKVQLSFSESENYEKGLSLISQLLNQYRNDLFLNIRNFDEIYYLQGYAASQLHNVNIDKNYYEIVEKSLLHNIKSYPNSKFYLESLRLLGAFYYINDQIDKAIEIFSEACQSLESLANNNSLNKMLLAETWFWLANCLDKMDPTHKKSRPYRKLIFTKASESEYADEAYFRYYPYQDYLKGKREAIIHLKEFDQFFPNSPYRIQAHYLMGLYYKSKNEKGIRKSIDEFLTSEELYRDFYEPNTISATPEKTLEIENLSERNNGFKIEHLSEMKDLSERNSGFKIEHLSEMKDLSERNNRLEIKNTSAVSKKQKDHFFTVHIRSKIERAISLLSLAEPQFINQAEQILHDLYSEFKNHFAYTPQTYSLMVPFREEVAYYLVKIYNIKEKNTEAQSLIDELLEDYRSKKITRGYYLSRIWYENGQLALRQGLIIDAKNKFCQAEDAAKGKVLSTDELLDLWIQQSICYQKVDELDEAMLLLSRVINYDAASSLRVKAMLLRAEIYEQQGRYELARKQIEATGKKLKMNENSPK